MGKMGKRGPAWHTVARRTQSRADSTVEQVTHHSEFENLFFRFDQGRGCRNHQVVDKIPWATKFRTTHFFPLHTGPPKPPLTAISTCMRSNIAFWIVVVAVSVYLGIYVW